ncbi:MAG TPA: hypothetical protein VD793_01310, partial [Gemmatimonadales bacterium]|nr:hypothetical protein [Gemmatimonadales bacterium]
LTVTNGFTNVGAIELSSVNAGYAATLTVTNGTLVNGPTGTITTLVGAGGGRALNVALDNQGLVTLNAALTINRASSVHTNSGTIDLVGGNLTVTQSGTTPSFTNSGTIIIPATRTFASGAGVFTNGVSGVVQGAGTFNATGTTFSDGGTFSPGGTPTAGALTFTGAYVQAAAGTLSIELGGTTPGTGYDQLAISGGATLGGTLNVTLINAFVPAGFTFNILTYTGTPVDFTTKNLPPGCTGTPLAGQYQISCS